MHNATLDTINRKTIQLEALLAVLAVADESATEDMDASTRSNFSWAMADLVSDIRAALNSETEARRG